jgi:putative intracellular protease/amidase
VAHDAEFADAVMQPVERGALELLEARANQSARSSQNPIEPASETDVQTVGKQMPATKFPRIANQVIQGESDRRIEGGDDCAGAGAHDDVDGNVVSDKLLQHSQMPRTAQSSAAEHHCDANRRIDITLMGTADSSENLR